MSTPRKTGPWSGGESGATATDLPPIEIPGRAAAKSKDVAGAKDSRAIKPIDYDKDRWKKIIDRKREKLETDVLAITRPRAKLDPIAKEALDALCTKVIERDVKTKEGAADKSVTPVDLEEQIRTYIVEKGIASEVKNVTNRLNARRMTDGRRWVLATTYVVLLYKLFKDKAEKIEKLAEDDLGVAEKIMLDMEAKGGPLDVFAGLIVDSVMKRNRINENETLLELVSQQVRSAI